MFLDRRHAHILFDELHSRADGVAHEPVTRSSLCSVHPSGSRTREKRMEKTALLRPSRCGVVIIHPCQQASFSSSSRYSDPPTDQTLVSGYLFFWRILFRFQAPSTLFRVSEETFV